MNENICETCGKPYVYVMEQCKTCYCNNFMRMFKTNYESALKKYKNMIYKKDVLQNGK